MDNNLTFEERVFVDAFVRTGNLRGSFSTAYVSIIDPMEAMKEADVLINTPYIKQAIKEHQKNLDELDPMDEKYVLRNLRRIAERCMSTEAVRDKDGIPTGEYIFNASGATKALELIGKNLKMFTENLDIKSSDVQDLVATLHKARANG